MLFSLLKSLYSLFLYLPLSQPCHAPDCQAHRTYGILRSPGGGGQVFGEADDDEAARIADDDVMRAGTAVSLRRTRDGAMLVATWLAGMRRPRGPCWLLSLLPRAIRRARFLSGDW